MPENQDHQGKDYSRQFEPIRTRQYLLYFVAIADMFLMSIVGFESGRSVHNPYIMGGLVLYGDRLAEYEPHLLRGLRGASHPTE